MALFSRGRAISSALFGKRAFSSSSGIFLSHVSQPLVYKGRELGRLGGVSNQTCKQI